MQMMNEALFAALMVATLIWLILCCYLFRILRTRYPDTYEEIGSPSLFGYNEFGNAITFAIFLFRKDWKTLDDKKVRSLCAFMRVYIACWLVAFVALCIQIP